jgi:cytochrome c oxidase subunit 1
MVAQLYFGFGVLSLSMAAALSLIIRCELSLVAEQLMLSDCHAYNVLITGHALIMIFMFLMPFLLGGLGNYFIPSCLGVPEMVFPRLNNVAMLLLPLSYQILFSSLVMDEGPGTGWTLYPPLAAYVSHAGLSTDLLIIGIHVNGISSCLSAANIVCTCCYVRRTTMQHGHLPIIVVCLFLTAVLSLCVLPILAASVTMVLTDRHLSSVFFDSAAGGDAVLFQHMF